VLNAQQIGQVIGGSSRPDPPEQPDLRGIFASWQPSAGSDRAAQTLECLPGLVRANEAWERDLAAAEQAQEEDASERGIFTVHSSTALDGLDADEFQWRGPEASDLDPPQRLY
jgi:hypothetical protein